MWNFLISGLLVGVDGRAVRRQPRPPRPGRAVAAGRATPDHLLRHVGALHPVLPQAGLRPRDELDLSALRAIGSTGAPLSPEGFRWIADAVGADVQICSVSGGTDLCTAFVGAAPDVPVWLGELSCRMLGAAVAAFDEAGQPS